MTATLIQDIPLNRIFPNPDQPRKAFDSEHISNLAESIKTNGLLQPIVVVPRFGKYMIVSGECRYRAHCKIGAASIQAIIRADINSAGKQAIQISAIIENVIRKDMTPMEEARAYSSLLASIPIEELARSIGVAKFRIAWRVKLLDMIPAAQNAFDNGELSMTQARTLGEMPEGLQEKLFAMIQAGRCNTDAKLKAAKAVLMSPVMSQSSLDIQTVDDSKAIAMKRKLEAIAAELADLTVNYKDDPSTMSGHLMSQNQATLDNMIRTAQMLQKELYSQQFKACV